jgi:hypothetical protein|tara:strand:- start:8908 stop:9273 length:366 start_codon:yes stop_codon:yes gene_type:complete
MIDENIKWCRFKKDLIGNLECEACWLTAKAPLTLSTRAACVMWNRKIDTTGKDIMIKQMKRVDIDEQSEEHDLLSSYGDDYEWNGYQAFTGGHYGFSSKNVTDWRDHCDDPLAGISLKEIR